MTGPMEGVRVLDLTTMVAGPVAAMMLGDQGADVIKIEPPGGDLMRGLNYGRRGMSGTFLACNRNKRSLAVDVKTGEGLEILRKLIATADVLVHNFRPGAAARIGLGEAAVRAIRHDIIYVSISGFGESGPYASQRAYDPVIQALCGLADIQRERDTGRPRMVRTIIADNTTALMAAQAITAALFARERSGEGQHVRLAMLDAMIAYLWPEAMPSLTFVGEERDPAAGEIRAAGGVALPIRQVSSKTFAVVSIRRDRRGAVRRRMGGTVPGARAGRSDRRRALQDRGRPDDQCGGAARDGGCRAREMARGGDPAAAAGQRRAVGAGAEPIRDPAGSASARKSHPGRVRDGRRRASIARPRKSAAWRRRSAPTARASSKSWVTARMTSRAWSAIAWCIVRRAPRRLSNQGAIRAERRKGVKSD